MSGWSGDFESRRKKFDEEFERMDRSINRGIKLAAGLGMAVLVTVLGVGGWAVVKLVNHFTS